MISQRMCSIDPIYLGYFSSKDKVPQVPTFGCCVYSGGKILPWRKFEDLRLPQQEICPFLESTEVSEAGKRERRVLQGRWEDYQYHVRYDMC